LKFLLVVPIHLTGLPGMSAGHERGLIDFCRKYTGISLSIEQAGEIRSVFNRSRLDHARKELVSLFESQGYHLDDDKYAMILSPAVEKAL